MTLKLRSRITVFILSFVVWILISGVASVLELLLGLGVAFFVALVSGSIFFKTGRSVIGWKFFYFVAYVMLLFWEMLKANIHVAIIVIHPKLPIRPGIVKINTDLKEDSSITVLANSITLTPGTLTVDVDPDTSSLFIHWLTVETFAVESCTRQIGGRFEPVIRRFMR